MQKLIISILIMFLKLVWSHLVKETMFLFFFFFRKHPFLPKKPCNIISIHLDIHSSGDLMSTQLSRFCFGSFSVFSHFHIKFQPSFLT